MTDIAALRKLLAVVPDRPWHSDGFGRVLHDGPSGDREVVAGNARHSDTTEAAVQLIVAAINALPALLDELEAFRATAGSGDAPGFGVDAQDSAALYSLRCVIDDLLPHYEPAYANGDYEGIIRQAAAELVTSVPATPKVLLR